MKKLKVNKLLIMVFFVIGIITIMIGTYLLYLSSPNRVFNNAINTISDKINVINEFNPNYKDYTMTTTLSIKGSSNELDRYSKDNDYYKIISNIINNYNNTKATIDYKFDKTNKSLFIDYKSSINNEDLLTGKYLIKNNTEYYYVNNITDTYINNGNNSYFETINSNTKPEDNIEYLNKFISNSIKNNIDKKYLKKEYNNKQTKITLELDNKRLNKIYKKVVNDLKNDSKAKSIITGYNRDFFKKQPNNIEFLKNKLYINIYTGGVFYKLKKYEIINGNNKIIYSNNKLSFYKNNKLKLIAKISYNKENSIKLYKNNKKIGYINIEKRENYRKISGNIEYKKQVNKFIFNIKKYDIKKNKYKQKITFTTNLKDNDKEVYNLDIKIDQKIQDTVKIKEDTSKSKLASSLSEEKKESISKKYDNIYNKVFK